MSYYYLLGLVVMGLCGIFDIILLTITIYQFCFKRYSASISGYFKRWTVITMLAYTICTVGDNIVMCIRYQNYPNLVGFTRRESYVDSAKDSIYYMGNMAFFILLLSRIQTSFQLSRRIMLYLRILLTTSIIFSIGFCFVLFYFGPRQKNDDLEYLHYMMSIYFLLI